MRDVAVTEILRIVPDDALVLDIGAWGCPFTRADHVVDIMPYDTRGLYGTVGPGPERFDESTWTLHDISSRAPLPFRDNEFDFVICSHVLEDVRDPVWVSSEIARVGKAGYLETPSRLEEFSIGVQGPWAGWGHHHWIVEMDEAAAHVQFTFKHHVVHGRPTAHFPHGFIQTRPSEERYEWMWWTGSFTASEQLLIGAEVCDPWFDDFVSDQLRRTGWTPPRPPIERRIGDRITRVVGAARRRRWSNRR